MTDLRELESLLAVWRATLAKAPCASEFGREAGFRAALMCCAEQLDETLKRMKETIDA